MLGADRNCRWHVGLIRKGRSRDKPSFIRLPSVVMVEYGQVCEDCPSRHIGGVKSSFCSWTAKSIEPRTRWPLVGDTMANLSHGKIDTEMVK